LLYLSPAPLFYPFFASFFLPFSFFFLGFSSVPSSLPVFAKGKVFFVGVGMWVRFVIFLYRVVF